MRSPSALSTQNGCADSAEVVDWLQAHHVAFVERNVSTDRQAAAELIATGILATPLLVTGEGRVFGFNPAKLGPLTAAARDR